MAELDPNNRQPWQEMGHGLLLPIMLLMLLWFRRGWLVQWALLGLLLPGLLLSPPAQAEPQRHLAAGVTTDTPAAIDWPTRLRITSYNVCYTKLLRVNHLKGTPT